MSLSSISPVGLTVTQLQARVRGHQLRNKQLLETAESGDISEVENLLARGADVNVKDKYGMTALHWAVTTEIVQLLLDSGADINAADNDGRTALHLAALYGSKDIVQALVIAGADVNATDNDGWTPLYWAVRQNSEDIVKLLLDRGADVNATDRYGRTALHEVVMLGDWAIVKALVIAGANVDAANDEGVTPLQIAALWGFTDIVKVLVKAGANVDTKNNSGETALQRATTFGHYVKVNNAIEEGKTDLINLAKAIPMIAKHLEKSLIPDVIPDIMSYANINKSQKIQAKKYMKARGIFYTEREEAAAATKIQAMARGNLVRIRNKSLNQKSK